MSTRKKSLSSMDSRVRKHTRSSQLFSQDTEFRDLARTIFEIIFATLSLLTTPVGLRSPHDDRFYNTSGSSNFCQEAFRAKIQSNLQSWNELRTSSALLLTKESEVLVSMRSSECCDKHSLLLPSLAPYIAKWHESQMLQCTTDQCSSPSAVRRSARKRKNKREDVKMVEEVYKIEEGWKIELDSTEKMMEIAGVQVPV